MGIYEVVKVFDLSAAPVDLRDAEDLAILRPRPEWGNSTILSLKVGCFDPLCDDAIDHLLTREVTYAEYQLHQWLVEQGAQQGEDVFLRWGNDPLV